VDGLGDLWKKINKLSGKHINNATSEWRRENGKLKLGKTGDCKGISM